jgi:hypothetical protein
VLLLSFPPVVTLATLLVINYVLFLSPFCGHTGSGPSGCSAPGLLRVLGAMQPRASLTSPSVHLRALEPQPQGRVPRMQRRYALS